MELSVFFGCAIACALGWFLVGLIETGLGGIGGLWVLLVVGVASSASAQNLSYWDGQQIVVTTVSNPGTGTYGPNNSSDAAWFNENNGVVYQWDGNAMAWVLTTAGAGGASPFGGTFSAPTPAGAPASYPGRGPDYGGCRNKCANRWAGARRGGVERAHHSILDNGRGGVSPCGLGSAVGDVVGDDV